jgi:hypothetical protein
MPLESQSQRRLFRWAEDNPEEAAKRGIKPGVAKELNQSDTGGKLPEKKRKLGYKHSRKRG